MVRISTNLNELGGGETGTTSPGITRARGTAGCSGSSIVTRRGMSVTTTMKWATAMKRQKRTCQGGEGLHSPDHGQKRAMKSAREGQAQQHEGGKVSREATAPVPVPEVERAGAEQG